jgi:ribonuclease Y
MKGRIIGREGRNIRAFEKATGTDVIVDDTPGVVVVSAFDSVRREIGRRSLERLIADGRIHPARIEEVVGLTRKEMEEQVREIGKKACYELDLHGLHPRLVQMLGRLNFRSSAGQNCLRHSVEVAQLAGLMAAEMRLDVALARRCGLLHDVGRALDHDVEGSHAIAGSDFARRCEEKKDVVNAIAAHHDEVKPESVYAVLTQVANRLSNSRPGTKREQLDKFIKRMERLEEVANSFLGVERAFAIQAGREVRVIAHAQRVDDRLAVKVCRDIARQIETELSYPGEVRVTLIRETRVVEYAM